MRSLQILSELLSRHYNKSVILLIDEYDVPMARATSNGYYKEMLEIMKGFMQALKDNPYLQLAVVTGCLKNCKGKHFYRHKQFCLEHDYLFPIKRIFWFCSKRSGPNS